MKYFIQLMVSVTLILAVVACKDDDNNINFNLDTEQITIGADGGVQTINVQSSGRWVASTEASWVSFSPANGIGTVDCEIRVDSTLLADEERQALVRFIADGENEPRNLRIIQNGYDRSIQLSVTEVEIPTYGERDDRKFEVELTSNVEFDVNIPEDINWVSVQDFDFELDRGSRPRTVKLVFNWEINSRPWERLAEIQFTPKVEQPLTRQDNLKVIQEKAALIEDNAQGDSLAIVACLRSLGRSLGSDEGETMANWSFVDLWHASDENVNPNDIGRVRSVNFYSFAGKEGIPYEIRYLTRAEEIIFNSSESYLLGKFSTGPDLSELKQLKRLIITGFGLTELDPSFVNLENLEYLDISFNHFSTVPDILTPENFPNLTYLDLGGSRRWTFSDLSNPPANVISFGGQETWGGLLGEREFPSRLLEWEKLEYLGLYNNYLQGELPDMENYPIRYTAEDLKRDTLPDVLLGAPKILPNTTRFRINLNLLEGNIPDWILYHPNLWRWNAFQDVFSQDEFMLNQEGRVPGFSNVPPLSLSYYWELYPHRKPEYED